MESIESLEPTEIQVTFSNFKRTLEEKVNGEVMPKVAATLKRKNC